jgi:hypothetical protein
MDRALAVEPFGFFTLDALRAGWYLTWRQLVRIIPVAVVGVLGGGLLTRLRMPVLGAVLIGLGVIAAVIWGAVLVSQLTSRWAEARYGYSLSGPGSVWWGVVWRVAVVSLVAGVILVPPNYLATSLTESFKGSVPLTLLGHALTALLGVANVIVTLLGTGWAMSRVTAAQLAGLPVAPAASAPAAVSEPLAVAPAPIPAAAPVAPAGSVRPTDAAPTASAPAGRADGKRQCPKCGLYETERGSVIGWYCTICGWREARR